MNKTKIPHQSLDSWERTEVVQKKYKEESEVSSSLSQAEARLTKIGLEHVEGDSNE